ncbi:chloride channel protein [Gemmiger sp.]|uniref:chloride channel protein n=1 Tax=Gemmiger sp. TaxID=2049027 RepID=UPI0025BB53E0|nr:chloride channel protein [Gemmiger sp.]
MGKVRHCLRSAAGYLAVCAKWLVLAALVGCVVGPLGAAFGLALNWANATRAAQPWLLYLLPIAGLVIVFLYSHFDPDGGGSTNQVFVSVREHKPMTLRTAPLIFASTVMTHLFGGSSGREGAALLLGGSVSGQIGKVFHLESRDCRLMTMCGMAGAFSAIFGTPLAATIFTLEVVDVGSMQYAALLPCLVSALLGVFISGRMGLAPESFVLKAEVAATPLNLVRVILLGSLLAALSIFFCELLHAAPKLYKKFLPNAYLRVAAGGVLILALTKLLGTTDYNGAGAAVIEAAIDGEAVPYAFLLKMLFTALTLGAGFKGGEIVPIFFTGATFGCVAAPLLGLPPQLGAALGMVALFCGCTNSPLASICLAIEVFGGQCIALFALACAVSYMLSSYFSLYREQHFLHSKLRIVGVQRVHGRWSETDAKHFTTNDDGEN